MYPHRADRKHALDRLQLLDDEDNYSSDSDNYSSTSYPNTPLPDVASELVEERLNKLSLSSEISSLASATGDMDRVPQTSHSLLDEARSKYEESRPPFCVSTPAVVTKAVRLSSNGNIKNITFHPWTEDYGYWILADQSLGQFIVKCSSNKYHVWAGSDEGFLEEPVAVACRKGRDNPREILTEQGDRNSKKKFRPRTARQSMPYTIYNVQKRHELRGIRLSDADLEEIINKEMSPEKIEASSKRDMQQAELIADANLSDGARSILSSHKFSTVDDDVSAEHDGEMIGATLVIRTHLHGFDLASIPIVVHRTDAHFNHQVLFELVKQKWAFMLAGRPIAYLVAMFPWLESDKNLLLQESEDDEFDFLLKEIRKYLDGWNAWPLDIVEINIEVFAA